jgi:hypothetical protein
MRPKPILLGNGNHFTDFSANENGFGSKLTDIYLLLFIHVNQCMHACLFSIHCFYAYRGYEKRSLSELVKYFNTNVDLVFHIIIWLVASAILENRSAGLSVCYQLIFTVQKCSPP